MQVLHGSTRGLMLTKIYEYYEEQVSANILNKSTKKMVHFSEGGPGSYGYNNTYSVLGNLIELSDGYMYVGGLEPVLSRSYGNGINEEWNVFVQKYSKNFYNMNLAEDMQLLKNTSIREASGTPSEYNGYGRLYLNGDEKDYGIKWLTDLKNNSVILVRAVKVKGDNIVILWEQFAIKENYSTSGEYQGYVPVNSSKRDMYYMIIDKNANVILEPTFIPNVNMNDEELYVYNNDKIYWTTTDSNKLNVHVLDISQYLTSLKGDYDENGTVDISDAYMLLRSIVKEEVYTDNQIKTMDMDDSGDIDITDAYYLLRYIVKNM